MRLTDALVQIVIVGLIAFTCPGLFNALGGLGKAGGKNADAGNSANAALYACFAVCGFFGGALFKIFGNKVLMFVGGLTYALYTLGMYITGNVENTAWLAPLCGAILGLGAGLFWTAQGAMMLAYATAETKGKYIYIFWIIFNLGGMIGGFISLGVNWNATDESQANAASYFTFVGLMVLGACSALVFLRSPTKVVKEDGTAVEISATEKTVCQEITGALKMVTNKNMLLLTVYFLGTNWAYTYQFNFVNGSLFNIRTRGLNSAVYWGMQMFAAFGLGKLLDYQGWNRRRRALVGYAVSTAMFAVAWIVGISLQYGFEGQYDKDNVISIPIDLTESSRCAHPIIAYCLYGLADAGMQGYSYWLMGSLAGNDLALSADYSGYYKSIQSAGAAVAWGIDLSPKVYYATQMWIAFSIWAVGTFLAFFAMRNVENLPDAQQVLAKLESAEHSAEV